MSQGPSAIARRFSEHVVVLFGTSVVTTGVGVITGVVLARLLGPEGKGDFLLVTLFPVLVMTVIDLGLPQAFGLVSAQGRTRGLVVRSVALAAGLAGVALVAVVVVMPILRETILPAVSIEEIALGLAVLPLALHATFTTAILLGLRSIRWFALVNNTHTLLGLALYAVVLGVLGGGLIGALWVALVVAMVQAGGYLLGAVRATTAPEDRVGGAGQRSVSTAGLIRLGLPFFPGSITQFLLLRIDVFLLALLLVDPSAPLGLYSMAVTMAQLVFFIPNAVAYVFFPHVASSGRAHADRQVAAVTRVTLIVTLLVALALAPLASVFILVVLPDFSGALPAFYVLLPAAVALSLSKVMGSYLAGLGAAGTASAISVAALAVNVVVNITLIPIFGIVGAAAASLVGYLVSTLLFSILVVRRTEVGLGDLWVPRGDDVRLVVSTVRAMVGRWRPRSDPGA